MRPATLVVILGALVVAFPAAGARTATFKGAVLAKESRRQAIVIASPNGVVRTVRVSALRQHVGARVNVQARRLHDGTFRSTRISIKGRASKALIRRAVVVRAFRGRLLVSAGGSVFSMRSKARRTVSVVGGSSLRPGTVINATVGITSSGQLQQRHLVSVGLTSTVELEGTVTSVGTSSFMLTFEEGGTPVMVSTGTPPPPGIVLGAEVELVASVGASGVYTLVSIDELKPPKTTGPMGSPGATGQTDDEGDDDCMATGLIGQTDEGEAEEEGDDDDDCAPTGAAGPTGEADDDEGEHGDHADSDGDD